MKLFELAHQFREAAEKLDDLELPDEVIADTLDGLSLDLQTKIENVLHVASEMAWAQTALNERMAALKKRAVSFERREQWLRRYVMDALDLAGLNKLDCGTYAVSMRKNPKSVQINNALAIPEKYLRITTREEPDKKAILAALEAGEEVPGVEITQSVRLEVK